jgi:hypothetical protein
MFSEDHFHDYPLAEIIEATVLYPNMHLRESILLVHREPEDQDAEDIINIRGEGEKENTD